MTFFTRPLHALALVAARPLRLVLPLVLLTAALLVVGTGDAGAVVTKVESTEVGLQPRNEESVIDGDTEEVTSPKLEWISNSSERRFAPERPRPSPPPVV